MKKDTGRIITGIDVGTSKVCTIISGVGDKGAVNVLGFGTTRNEGMKKGLVVDIDGVTQAIYRSVGEAEKMAGHVVDSAYVSISGSHISANSGHGSTQITSKEKGITREDMRRALEASKYLLIPPDKQIFDIVEHDYGVDGQSGILDPVGMSGSHLEARVHIITGSTAFVQNLTKCVIKLGIEIEGLILSPLASGEAVLDKDEKDVGIIVLDIGSGTTDVAVFRGGHLQEARIIPVGSTHIDNDIAVIIGTSSSEAERLKIDHGKAFMDGRDDADPILIRHVGQEISTEIPRAMLCQVIQPRVCELLNIVKNELEDCFRSSSPPAGVVLTGGGSLLTGLPEMVDEVLGYRARIARPIYDGDNADKVISPQCATAYGLIRCAVTRTGRSPYFAQSGKASATRNVASSMSRFFKGLFK